MSAPVQLSLLLPLRDGAAIPELYIAVTTACERLGRGFELLFIDDGTRDGSAGILDALVDEDPRVRVVHLRRPLGRPVALTAGFARARGDIVLTLEPDDDDPAMIADFVARIDAGADLVTGWRQRPGAGPDLRSRLLRRLAAIDLHDPSCGLRAYRRDLLLALPNPPGGERFLPLLAHTQGFRVEELVVHPRDPKRKNDEGGLLAALADLLQIVLLTRHPHRPLRLLAVPGLLIAAAGFVLLLLGSLLGSLLLILGLLTTLVGTQLVIAGFLAEQIASSRAPAHYAVRDEREATPEAHAAFLRGAPRPLTASHRTPTQTPAQTRQLTGTAGTAIATPGVATPGFATPGPALGDTTPSPNTPHPGFATVHPSTQAGTPHPGYATVHATPAPAGARPGGSVATPGPAGARPGGSVATPGPAVGPTRTVVAPVQPTPAGIATPATLARPPQTRTAPAPVVPPNVDLSIEEDDEYDEDGPATVALDRNPYKPR